MKPLPYAILLLSSPCLAAPPAPKPMDLEASALRFSHIAIETGETHRCEHVRQTPYDWKVTCPNRPGVEFPVHFAASRYTKTVEPRASYEILYWIQGAKPVSTTTWFHLKDDSALHSLELRQGIEDDQAYLEVTFAP